MIASIAMPTIELIKLATAMTTNNNGKVSWVSGNAAIASTPSAEQLVAKMYHLRGEKVTSTMGAHVHFNQLVSRLAPFSSEVSATESPLALAMNVSATATNPLKAPKGT